MSEVSPRNTTPMEVERTFSAQEAAVLLGRSHSWLDMRVRAGQFTLKDGTVIEPLRTRGGYRRFTPKMLLDISTSCYRRGWFTMNSLQRALTQLVAANGGLVPPP
jgi:hypothetical protein